MIERQQKNNLMDETDSGLIKKFEMYAINVVLQQAEILAIINKNNRKANRIQALEFVFNIPLDIQTITEKARLSLCRDDIVFLIDMINEYSLDFSPSKMVRHAELKGVLPKVMPLKDNLESTDMFIPSMSHVLIYEFDVLNVIRGLNILKSQIEQIIEENKELSPLYGIFEDELTKEVSEVDRLMNSVPSYRKSRIGDLVSEALVSDMREYIYKIGLLINGVNAYEEDQYMRIDLENLINTRETLKKLLFIQGTIKASYY